MKKKQWAATGVVLLVLVFVFVATRRSAQADADPETVIASLRALQARHHAGNAYANGSQPGARNLSLIGNNDFEGAGFNADVWALGNYAYVGTWGAYTAPGTYCPNMGTKVVDISDPTSPTWVASIPAPAGTQTNDVKVARINTATFSGDLLVVSNEDCALGGARGFELWDVTDPTAAVPLGRYGPEEAYDVPSDLVDIGYGVHNTFLFTQGGRAYVAAIIDYGELFQLLFGATQQVGDVRLVDVTDPRNPTPVADWGIVKNLGLDPFAGQGDDFALSFVHDVWIENGIAYLSYWDAGLVLLDVSDPAEPQFISRTPYALTEEGNTHVAVPAQGGNLVITGDEDFTAGPWGFMRVFNSRDASGPFQVATYATDNTLNAPPPLGDFSIHNLFVRGHSVYASWYSDGIRVIDISQPAAPREIASFVPPGATDPYGIFPPTPLMWGIYVQGSLVFGSDINAGLYILKHTP